MDDLLSKLGSAEKAALRLLIDLPSPTLNQQDRAFFSSHPWTGVILFQKNIEDRKQVQDFIGSLQSINQDRFPNYPLFVSVDEEGGSVSPLEKIMTPSPGNMALAATLDLEGTYQISRLLGSELRSLGFNVNFSPVVDVNSNPKNPIIGIRSFGEDPKKVGSFGSRVIQAYQEEGVMATAKHFPGHGDTSKDSHLDLPVVNRTKEELKQLDLLPFEMSIEAGVSGMMTAHVIYPALDKKPATLSKTILTQLLRKEMNFQGIIFTDSFEMAAIKEHFDLEEAVLGSIEAGADVLLALGNVESQLATFEILKKAIEKKKISEENIIQPLKRILSFRKRLGEFKRKSDWTIERNLVESLHQKSVTVVSGREKLPLSKQAEVLLSLEASKHQSIFQTHFKDCRFVPWPWPSSSIASSKPRWIFLAERRLLDSKVETALKPLTSQVECVVSFGNPYFLSEFPSDVVRVTTYHFNETFVKAVYEVLIQGKKGTGKLPITL